MAVEDEALAEGTTLIARLLLTGCLDDDEDCGVRTLGEGEDCGVRTLGEGEDCGGRVGDRLSLQKSSPLQHSNTSVSVLYPPEQCRGLKSVRIHFVSRCIVPSSSTLILAMQTPTLSGTVHVQPL